MKEGDTVMVYRDPVTCRKPEGRATLVEKSIRERNLKNHGGPELWIVRFMDEDETFFRLINKENH